MKKLCIYHGNCADGFTAAWSVYKALGDGVEFYKGIYGEPVPDVTDREVIIVDFSYKRDVLTEMAKKAKSILILDHHKTAEADIQPLIDDGTVQGIFDMNRSGAMIAWEYFNPKVQAPMLVRYAEDRDLWRFKLEGCREYAAAVFSYEYTFENWDTLARTPVEQLIEQGKTLERKHFKDIEELIKLCKTRMVIGGYDVPVANMPYQFASDACHIMAKDEPFAATYYVNEKDRVIFSLRSSEEGVDVSAIAAQYGGGGHKHASGFSIQGQGIKL